MPSFGGVGKEAITFVLSGDASGLISEFKDVEKAADKSLGATETKIEKLSATMTKVGAVSMATGLSTALGLVQFVKDAEEAEKATNKFETAVKGMGSSIKTADIKKLAFDLQQVAQVTDEQVVAAARWGAVYGLTTDQLEELLRTAVDLSEQTGKSLDVVTKQLAKAASGEGYKGLTKLGLTFDETAYKADAFGTTIAESTEFAGGAAAKATDTMSGQLTRLGNNWDNVKEQIGAGANEVFEPLARGAADLLENLAQANPELLTTVGHVTALGSLGMTGFGAIASLAGQIVNIKDAVDGLGLKLKNAQGGFTNLGKAAVGLGLAGLAIGAADVALAFNDAADGGIEFKTALDRLKSSDTTTQSLKNLLGIVDANTSGFDDFADSFSAGFRFIPGMEDKVGSVTKVLGGMNVELNRTMHELEGLRDSNPEEALKGAKALLEVIPKGDQGPALNDFRTQLQGMVKDIEGSADAKDKAAKASGEMTKADEDSAEALKVLTKNLEHSKGALGFFEFVAESAALKAKKFSSVLEQIDFDEVTQGALDLGAAVTEMFDDHGEDESIGPLIDALPAKFDAATAAAGGYKESQQKAIEGLIEMGDQLKATGTSLLENGTSTDFVKAAMLQQVDAIRQKMIPAFVDQGLSLEDATTRTEDYIAMLGLTPPDIDTAIKLSGDEDAKWRLTLLAGAISTFEASKQNEINLLIAQGDVQGALAATQAELNRRALTVPVKAVFNGWSGQNPYGVGYSGGGGWGKAAPDGLSVVPMAAPTKAAPTPPPITINVTAGIGDPAEIGRKVIDAIRAAERVQGRGWRAV